MTVRYRFQPGASRFMVQGVATGMLSVMAHNPTIQVRDFACELEFSTDTFEDTSLQLTLRAETLEVTGNVKAQDREEIQNRMRQEVLEISKFPEVRYQCTKVMPTRISEGWYRLQFNGELSLHGVTRPTPVDSQFRLNDEELHLSGECTLLQSAFRIRRVTALAGSISLKDELKLSFDLVAKKEQS
jgi:polyisoprenoid-binding protein YceI